MPQIYIKPAVTGQIVRHPEKRAYVIPHEGDYVEDSTEWQRHLRHGDVVLAEPPQFPKPEKSANKTVQC